MTKRELRSKRKYWKNYKRDLRKRQTNMKNILTPPGSPLTNDEQAVQEEGVPVALQENVPGPSRQNIASKRKRKREKAKVYRTNKLLIRKLEESNRRVQMYRMRLKREKNKMNLIENKKLETPRSRTKRLFKHASRNFKSVRKTLDFHHVLINEMQNSCEKNRSMKKSILEILRGKLFRKYKLTKFAHSQIQVTNQSKRKRKSKQTISANLRGTVKAFFERDDNSRITTDKKKTKTVNKIKKQIRFLNDTLSNLFVKFKAENNDKIGFITFWTLKPYWIRKATEKERETCLCKCCENVGLIADCLKKAKIVETANLESLVKETVCSMDNLDCMYGNCLDCKQSTVKLTVEDKNDEVTWSQWQTKKIKKTFKGGDEKELSVTVKEKESASIEKATEKLHELLRPSYSRHLFNIKNQYKHYKTLKETLSQTECLIHVDFSENYSCKMSKEIQSMHFGASLPQISLHTGYYVTKDMDTIRSFCGVSDSLRHDPQSIWAYMLPILNEIKDLYPFVEYLHFYSDGPTSQYRQKINFYLLSTMPFELGFTGACWNFHEAGHGKGIPDGIGGSIKRSADRQVSFGADILTADAFIKSIETGTKIKLYEVKEPDVLEVDKRIPIPLKTIPGTMKIHQIFTESERKLRYRGISCIDVHCSDHLCDSFEFSAGGGTDEAKLINKSEPLVSTSTPYTDLNLEIKNSYKKDVILQRKMEKDKTCQNKNSSLLQTLQQCGSFEHLQITCLESITETLHGKDRFIEKDNFAIDNRSMKLFPDDVCTDKTLFPVQVRADGNCLPACGSVFVFGNDSYADEIRAHIIKELSLNKKFYLDKNYLSNAFGTDDQNKNILKSFAMYSDEYTHGVVLTERSIEDIYEREIMQIRNSKTYMGIWQIFALASVIRRPIVSVYPKKGNPNVRKDLYRRIEPMEKDSDKPLYIMWTSTRLDMNNNYWVPNHFVPLLEPVEIIPDANNCLHKYVIVDYESTPYPGYVEDVDSSDVYVVCMQRLERDIKKNVFYWPKAVKDKCWYNYSRILAIISKPKKIKGSSSNYEVDPEIWTKTLSRLQY
ncbi:unnamed protein product [Mytilus edulis]|uniref:Vertnin n=1 Tax=Mytilus edulis TaxID=6550 RepID=A0A8S3PUF8_MYTED|nr:unnamed protein product [Mytilus edulis]